VTGTASTDPGADELLRRVAALERELQDRDQQFHELRREIERLRAADAESQWLVAAVENSDDFIGIGGLDGRALYVNSAGRRLVGLDGPEDVLRTKIPEYFLPEDLPFVEGTILPEVLQRGVWRGEFRFRNFKTGASIPVYYVLFAIRDRSSGELTGLATVTQDMTLRKQGEQERARLKDEIIRAQTTQLAELSTPLIPITDRVVVVPLIGTVDAARAALMLDALLAGVSRSGASVVILDLTGARKVDEASASAFLQSARAVRLLGARLVLSGMSASLAQTLVQRDIDFAEIATYGSLQSAVAATTTSPSAPPRR